MSISTLHSHVIPPKQPVVGEFYINRYGDIYYVKATPFNFIHIVGIYANYAGGEPILQPNPAVGYQYTGFFPIDYFKELNLHLLNPSRKMKRILNQLVKLRGNDD